MTQKKLTASKKPSRRHEDATFPVRRVDFDFSQTPKYIYDNNALASYFWLVLQAEFPDGEQFFIDSVRGLRDKVEDGHLQADISAFIGQEAMHGRAHRLANQQLLEVHGIDVIKTEKRTARLMQLFNRMHSPKQRLAATAGAEHLTASIARFLLRNPDYLAGFKNPTIRKLVMWHALEEREHRAVAFDVYQLAGGDYATRVAMYVWFIAALAPFAMLDIMKLMAQDGSLKDVRGFAKGLKSLFGKRGLFSLTTPALLDYFRRDFHPNDDDQTVLEAAWRNELGLQPA